MIPVTLSPMTPTISLPRRHGAVPRTTPQVHKCGWRERRSPGQVESPGPLSVPPRDHEGSIKHQGQKIDISVKKTISVPVSPKLKTPFARPSTPHVFLSVKCLSCYLQLALLSETLRAVVSLALIVLRPARSPRQTDRYLMTPHK